MSAHSDFILEWADLALMKDANLSMALSQGHNKLGCQ